MLTGFLIPRECRARSSDVCELRSVWLEIPVEGERDMLPLI